MAFLSRPIEAVSKLTKLLVGLFFFRLLQVIYCKKNRLTFKQTDPLIKKEKERILAECPSLNNFHMPFFHIGGVLQSAWSKSMLSDEREKLERRREVITLPKMKKPEGASCCPDEIPAGEVSIDWVDPAKIGGNAEEGSTEKIVILAPGLTGCSRDSYMVVFTDILAKAGYKVACYNPRGRGGVPISSSFLYSAGYTEDFRRVVRIIRDRHPQATLFSAGFSLGSNYLTKYIGEEGAACVFRASLLCACPLELISMSNHFSESMLGRLMDKILVGSLQKMRIELDDCFEHEQIDVEDVLAAKSLFEFDHKFTAPMFGLDCGSDYYREASSGRYLGKIRTNCLFLHASNDPIIQIKYIRMDNFRANPCLLHCLTNGGGHSMSWPSGWMGRKSWSAQVAVEYFNTHH